MAVDISWTRAAHYFLFAVQILFCTQLYLTQLSLNSKLSHFDSSQDNGMELHRQRMARSVDSLDSSKNVTVDTTDDRRRRHRNLRVSVSKYIISTNSTTNAPVMQRRSRVKSTGMRSRLAKEDELAVGKETRGHHPLAIHYVAHVDKRYRSPDYGYLMNGRMKVSGEYKHWQEADWTSDVWPNGHKPFKMRDGHVFVSRAGLYLLYAQIHYATHQTYNCFQAKVNGNSIGQCCTTAVHPPTNDHKAATCSLVTTVFLHSDDLVSLHELHTPEVILTQDKSFFGLIQLFTK